MQRILKIAGLLGAALALQGCLAKTAWDVVTLPVKAASAVVDGVTESQSEADEKRGRELRQLEERLGRLEREYYKADAKCREGNDAACAKRSAIAEEMQALSRDNPAIAH